MFALFRRKRTVANTEPLDREQVSTELERQIGSWSAVAQELPLQGSTPLFSAGLLDSLQFLDLVLFVERRFSVELGHVAEPTPEKLDTVDKIVELILSASTRSRP
ncbi:MAG: acyl carrier protein [Deltaproteobacteria bacterium]|nr:acyl carrier protein [Deltaproteobacteria bacterium]